MKNIPKEIYAALREVKNRLVTGYYSFRIETPKDPYSILFSQKSHKVLWVLGHMRAGTSLFSHILNTHPDLIGFGETHIEYESEADLQKLAYKVYHRLRCANMSHQYVFDKILHNNKIINEQLIEIPQIDIIFLIREPEETVLSLIKLKPHWNRQQAMDYYVKRLEKLEKNAQQIDNKKRCFVMTYEQLIWHTEPTFVSMKEFLKVQHPFSEEYEISEITGQKHIGDQSENIKTGRIIRKEKKSDPQIDPKLLEKGIKAYNQCYQTLTQYCTFVEI
ncbi:sulfotransferase family protein [Lusitaniella coriacea]|uniref:sulfotransferase family protein n=1 Tax=Lusitaniella coriacea TaxID=1983105 RepID=UPI003CED2DC3